MEENLSKQLNYKSWLFQNAAWVILLSIAFLQFILSTFTGLSPWKGGGFAMFSAVTKRGISCEAKDQFGNKVRCTIRFPGKGEYGPLNDQSQNSFFQFPTQSKLDKIRDNFMQYEHKIERVRIKDLPEMVLSNTNYFMGKINSNYVKALRLHVYELKFDNQGHVSQRDLQLVSQIGEWND